MKRINNSSLKHTAQAYLNNEGAANKAASSCGSSCGAGDSKPTSSCGSSCGAGDK